MPSAPLAVPSQDPPADLIPRSGLLEAVASVPHRAPRNGERRFGTGAELGRVAVVHDWLPVYAGAERVLEQMLGVLPRPQLFTLLDFLEGEQRAFLGDTPVRTSFMQRLPRVRTHYRYYVPFAPLAVEQFDFGGFDTVISSSYVAAKGVLTTADQFHLAYVHSPVRYAWDLHAEHATLAGGGLRGMLARIALHYLRLFDVASANRVDAFVANSQHVARRIWKTYRRRAAVVYPPVDTSAFALHEAKEEYYVTVSRLVPYKRMDLIVRAFALRPDRELIVIGDGPELDALRRLAPPNVAVLGFQPFEVVRHYMQRARAFVFAAEEDFGIVPVEAQACGTPVIAFGRGGSVETVLDGETGVLFPEQSVDALLDALDRFERMAFEQMAFEPGRVREHAERFGVARFRRAFAEVVEREHAAFLHHGGLPAFDRAAP